MSIKDPVDNLYVMLYYNNCHADKVLKYDTVKWLNLTK